MMRSGFVEVARTLFVIHHDSNTSLLEPSIRKYLLPLLKNDGFAGSGRTFRRIDNDAIHLVNVQGFTSTRRTRRSAQS